MIIDDEKVFNVININNGFGCVWIAIAIVILTNANKILNIIERLIK